MKRITEWRTIAVRLRREDDVRADLGKINFQIWIKVAMDREALKRSVEQAKLTKSCSAKRSKKKEFDLHHVLLFYFQHLQSSGDGLKFGLFSG